MIWIQGKELCRRTVANTSFSLLLLPTKYQITFTATPIVDSTLVLAVTTSTEYSVQGSCMYCVSVLCQALMATLFL